MRKKGRITKKINTAFGLILILAVIIASPVFGFGLGLATMEWKPAQASTRMVSGLSPASPAAVSEPAAAMAPEPTVPPPASPTPDDSANPLSRPVPEKIEGLTPAQNGDAEQELSEAAVNENNSSPAPPESTDTPGKSAPIPLRDPASVPAASPAPTPGRQGAPVPFRRDSSEGEAFTVG